MPAPITDGADLLRRSARPGRVRLGPAGLAAAAILLSACSREARTLGPTPPQTRPLGNADPRIASYQDNVYQVAQGGRYFSWYGCAGCHRAGATEDLAEGRLRHGSGFADVFGVIADGHGALRYGQRVPVEQLWQITAHVRDLPAHFPEKRRRNAADQQAEPPGASWSGPQ